MAAPAIAAGAAPTGPPPEAEVDEDCEAVVSEAGIEWLVNAMCALEGVGRMTMKVLKNIGVGASSGVKLLECVGAKESAEYRQKYVTELVAIDQSLYKITPPLGKGKASERAQNSMKELMRMIAELCEILKKAEKGPAPDGATTAQKSILTVVTQTEEDRETTLASLDSAAVGSRRELLKTMYNVRLQPHEMAQLNQLKRIGHWVVTERCFPDPGRYPYTKMTGASTDGHLMQFRRMLLGCVLVAVGDGAPKDKRDDGAGKKDLRGSYKAQWANANVAIDLLAQIEEKRDVLTNAEIGLVCATLSTALYKSTSLGGETLSLAMAQAISTVPQVIQNAQAVAARTQTKQPKLNKPPEGELTDKQKKKKKEEEKKRQRQLDLAQAGSPPAKEPKTGEGKPGVAGWADEEGAIGPNRLPRMVGGNPEGDLCKYIQAGRTCRFKTCSFSHEE